MIYLQSIMLMMHSHLTYRQCICINFDNALAFGIDHAFIPHFDHALTGCHAFEDAHAFATNLTMYFKFAHAFAKYLIMSLSLRILSAL